MVGFDKLIWAAVVGLASWEKLNLVPEGDVMLDPDENGELPAVSWSPPAECDRSHSFASSWLRSWEEGVYLSPFLGKVFLSRCGSLSCLLGKVFLQNLGLAAGEERGLSDSVVLTLLVRTKGVRESSLEAGIKLPEELWLSPPPLLREISMDSQLV